MSYLQDLFSLSGKTAVIIGGTGELCGAMAEGIAAAGASVVLVGRSEEKAQARIANITASGGTATFEACQVDSRDELESLKNRIIKSHRKVDILVNGAGTNSATPFLEIEEDEWDWIFRVNMKGVFLACQIFGPQMISQENGGSIINVGSMSGLIPLSRVFTYSASKAAVHNLSKNLAREWATQNVRVNTLVPGFFPAEQNKKVLTPERVQQIMGHTPMNRFGNANELIGATLLLASDAGSFMTGVEMVVDGGYAAMTI